MSVYFAIKCKNSTGLFCNSNCIHLSLHIKASSSNVNIVALLVSTVYACCAIVAWFCSHHFLWLSLKRLHF